MALLLSRPGRYWQGVVRDMASRPGGYSRALGWLAMYTLSRIVVVRRIAGRVSRHDADPVPEVRPSMFDADVGGVVETLRVEGFDARLRLPANILRELASFGEGVSGSAPYSNSERPDPALVEKIAGDPLLLEVAALYLGSPPIYQGSRIWWTRPGERADPRETGARFHYDLYDYTALVFLFYLTDVGPDAGPHVCVRASHRRRKWRDQLHPRRHRSDGQIVRLYGEDRIVTICGPAGTVIAEDPFCFHKVKLPAQRERLALQLLYTGHDVPAPSFNRVTTSRSDAGLQ